MKISCVHVIKRNYDNNTIYSCIGTSLFILSLSRFQKEKEIDVLNEWRIELQKNRRTMDANRCLSLLSVAFQSAHITTILCVCVCVSRAASFDGTITINSVMSSLSSCHLVFVNSHLRESARERKMLMKARKRKKTRGGNVLSAVNRHCSLFCLRSLSIVF